MKITQLADDWVTWALEIHVQIFSRVSPKYKQQHHKFASCSQFHQQFKSSFSSNFLAPKYTKQNFKYIKPESCSYNVGKIDTCQWPINTITRNFMIMSKSVTFPSSIASSLSSSDVSEVSSMEKDSLTSLTSSSTKRLSFWRFLGPRFLTLKE